jgi:hypothetical protein
VLTQAHLTRLVCCIQFNPQRHGLIHDFRRWPSSTYRAHLSNQATLLNREIVLGWFNGPADFAAAHRMAFDETGLAPLAPDDFDETWAFRPVHRPLYRPLGSERTRTRVRNLKIRTFDISKAR